MRCPYGGAEIHSESILCPACHVSVEDGLPMRWYRFLITVGLWLAGVGTVLLGFAAMFGMPYLIQGYAPGVIYDSFPPLVVMDCVYGIALAVFGAMFIVARFRLAALRRSGPILLCVVYALVILISVLYSAASGRVVAGDAAPLIGMPELCSLLGMLIGVTMNVIYFRKRKHLFYQ